MDDTVYILIADYVPTANKGEEAIVRGIEDMLSDGRPVALGLFDNVAEPQQHGNIAVFPRDWIFRFEGNHGLSARRRLALQAAITLQLRMGMYSRLKNLTRAGDPKCRPLQDFFERADYVLVGHDGVFCVESCGIIHLAKRHKKRTGMLGASTGIGPGRFYKARLYRDAMTESDFCIFRERHSRESMQQISSDPGKLLLAPDPAFAMQPADPQRVAEVLRKYEGYQRACAGGRPIVGVTVLEKGRVYEGFRLDLKGAAKQRAHAEYVAAILDALVCEYNAFVVFLPHAVEADGSDIVAARHVAEAMNAARGDILILDESCDARTLKGLIGLCDFLLGERTHSMIGAVSMGTPFAGLTNHQDTRTHGIIGAMCQCEHQIVNMDMTDSRTTIARVRDLFESRESIRANLTRIQQYLSERIATVLPVVRGLNRRRSGSQPVAAERSHA